MSRYRRKKVLVRLIPAIIFILISALIAGMLADQLLHIAIMAVSCSGLMFTSFLLGYRTSESITTFLRKLLSLFNRANFDERGYDSVKTRDRAVAGLTGEYASELESVLTDLRVEAELDLRLELGPILKFSLKTKLLIPVRFVLKRIRFL